MLLGCRHDLGMQREMLPGADGEPAQQQKQGRDPEAAGHGVLVSHGNMRGRVIGGRARTLVLVHVRDFDLWESFVLTHWGSSANTPRAGLPSFPLRSKANRYGTISSVVGVANRSPPMTARASAAL